MDKTFGQCWTFNKNGTENQTTTAGPSHGLRLTLDIGQHSGVYMMSTDAAGVKVAIHNPGTHPFPRSLGYSARINARTSFALTLERTERLSLPWGNCTSDDRKEQTPFSYFYEGSYTFQGCMDSCLQKQLIEKCGCAHYR